MGSSILYKNFALPEVASDPFRSGHQLPVENDRSVNGIIGSINRRYSFRLDKTKYDRKTGRYDFLNANIRISFSDAIDALNQVSTDGLPYEKYNYEDIHFETRYGSKKTTAWTIKLNPAAIDEFMREDSESHEFSESWDLGENSSQYQLGFLYDYWSAVGRIWQSGRGVTQLFT